MDLECVLCKQSTIDLLQLGEKHTLENVTAHYHCMLLASNLTQSGKGTEGILGFMPKDILAEVKRAKRLVCSVCEDGGASIGCCVKKCRNSFHLPCALTSNCSINFANYRTFCKDDRKYQPPAILHTPTEPCTICLAEMGPYRPNQSIQTSCCNTSWSHKLCLAQYAQTSGYFFKCPLCKNSKQFRQSIMQQGIFIPNRDAEWERVEEDEFYGFTEQTNVSKACQLKECKCPKGATYTDRTIRYALANCVYCGSVYHRSCYINSENKKKTICEDCLVVEKSKTSTNTTKTKTGNGKDIFTRRSDNKVTFDEAEFKLRRCIIRLPRIDISKLNYDANGRVIVLDEESTANKTGVQSKSAFTIASNILNEDDGNALDINDNSTDFTMTVPDDYDKIENQSMYKADDSVIVINDTFEDENEDDDETVSSSESSFFKRLSFTSIQSCSSTENLAPKQRLHRQFEAEHSSRKRFSIESSGSTSRTSTDLLRSLKTKKRRRESNDSKLSPDYKKQRKNSTEYNPKISLSDTRKNVSTKYYKTTSNNSNGRLSSSSTSGFEDQSSSGSQTSFYQTPIKKEMPSTIRSYFPSSLSNFLYDATPIKQPIKRKRPTPRKLTPPINLDGQRTITEMFNKPSDN